MLVNLSSQVTWSFGKLMQTQTMCTAWCVFKICLQSSLYLVSRLIYHSKYFDMSCPAWCCTVSYLDNMVANRKSLFIADNILNRHQPLDGISLRFTNIITSSCHYCRINIQRNIHNKCDENDNNDNNYNNHDDIWDRDDIINSCRFGRRQNRRRSRKGKY